MRKVIATLLTLTSTLIISANVIAADNHNKSDNDKNSYRAQTERLHTMYERMYDKNTRAHQAQRQRVGRLSGNCCTAGSSARAMQRNMDNWREAKKFREFTENHSY